MPYISDVSNYVAKALRDEWEQVPRFLEPFNEPMVHAGDFATGLKGADKRLPLKQLSPIFVNIIVR